MLTHLIFFYRKLHKGGNSGRKFINKKSTIFSTSGNHTISVSGAIEEDRKIGGSVAEWFRALDLNSGGPWFKSSTLLQSGFVIGSPECNSSTALCKYPTGQPPAS